MRFFYDNEIDDTDYTLTSNSVNASYPLANLRDFQLAKRYRTTDVSSEWVKIDAGAGNTITATFAYIAGHNITDGATIKIQGNDTDSWDDPAPTVDETITHDAGVMVEAFASQSLRYWQFTIADAANGDGYLSIGRLGLGTYFDLTESPDRNFRDGLVDTSVVNYSLTGQPYGDERITYQEYDFQLSYLTNTDRTNLRTMYADVKMVEPIVIVPLVGDTTLDNFYGTITDFDINHLVGLSAWTGRISLREAK